MSYSLTKELIVLIILNFSSFSFLKTFNIHFITNPCFYHRFNWKLVILIIISLLLSSNSLKLKALKCFSAGISSQFCRFEKCHTIYSHFYTFPSVEMTRSHHLYIPWNNFFFQCLHLKSRNNNCIPIEINTK